MAHQNKSFSFNLRGHEHRHGLDNIVHAYKTGATGDVIFFSFGCIGRMPNERIDISLGTNIVLPKGGFADNSLALEGSVPVYQDLDGIQLETDYRLILGWRLTF